MTCERCNGKGWIMEPWDEFGDVKVDCPDCQGGKDDKVSVEPFDYGSQDPDYKSLNENARREVARLRAKVEELTKERDSILSSHRILNVDAANWQARAQSAEAKVAELTKERDERETEIHDALTAAGAACSLDGDALSIEDRIAWIANEKEARAQSAEAALAEMREAAKAVIENEGRVNPRMQNPLDALRSLVNKEGE